MGLEQWSEKERGGRGNFFLFKHCHMLHLSGYGETAIWAMTNDMQPQRRLQACTNFTDRGKHCHNEDEIWST